MAESYKAATRDNAFSRWTDSVNRIQLLIPGMNLKGADYNAEDVDIVAPSHKLHRHEYSVAWCMSIVLIILPVDALFINMNRASFSNFYSNDFLSFHAST